MSTHFRVSVQTIGCDSRKYFVECMAHSTAEFLYANDIVPRPATSSSKKRKPSEDVIEIIDTDDEASSAAQQETEKGDEEEEEEEEEDDDLSEIAKLEVRLSFPESYAPVLLIRCRRT